LNLPKIKKTIFVTGGSGFIGSNIIEFFCDTATIIAPSHTQLDLLSQDAVNKFFKEHKIDYVIHCANFGGNRKSGDTIDIVEKNVRIFFNLIENSRYFDKFIHFGSGAEYDKSRPISKITETSFGERIPRDHYGFSKYLISKFIENSENIICLRLFGVFGKYEDYEYKFISNTILKNLLQLPIHIRQNVYFDWLYINDLVKILPYFLDHEPLYKMYNITPNKPLDLVTIANMINSYSTFKSEIIVDNPGLNNEYSGNNSRLLAHIGNFTFTEMHSALSELRKYYCSILPQIDSDTIRRDEYSKYCTIRLPS
jgi:nucleoside-diphosphate-sugar epimerase